MAPIKFEEHIKEQLEERRLEPSAAAWERISGQLDLQQGKKKSKHVLLMAIAASFIIGVTITAIFLQNDTTDIVPVVITPEKTEKQDVSKKDNEKLNAPEIMSQRSQEQITQIEAPKSTNVQKREETTTTQKRKAKRKQPPIMSTNFTEAVTTTNNTKRSQIKNVQQEKQSVINQFKESPNSKDITLEFQNSLEDVFQVDSETIVQIEDKELVTDQEVEDLLRNAQRDIVNKQLLKVSTITAINANDLLLDVEYEADPQRFKDKIFRTLKQELGKALDAVVNKGN